MGTRRYRDPGQTRVNETVERVLVAAEELVRAGKFHAATMEDLARHAGVSRATLFARFGSRLRVLEALNVRCAESPEIQALHAALAIDDPLARLEGIVEASCLVWEHWGDVQRHLRAIVVLEPEVRPLIEAQRRFQRESLRSLTRQMARRGLLRDDLSLEHVAVTLHMLTGLEGFVELRREGGMSLDQTIATIRDLALYVVRR